MKTQKFLTKVIQVLCQEFNTAPACDMPELAEAICKVHKVLKSYRLFFAAGFGSCLLLEVVTYGIFRFLV
jgi:hypothetical protein